MFGYRSFPQTAETLRPFVIIRFPKELADALGFQIAF